MPSNGWCTGLLAGSDSSGHSQDISHGELSCYGFRVQQICRSETRAQVLGRVWRRIVLSPLNYYLRRADLCMALWYRCFWILRLLWRTVSWVLIRLLTWDRIGPVIHVLEAGIKHLRNLLTDFDPGRRPLRWLSKRHSMFFLLQRLHRLSPTLTAHFILTRRHAEHATFEPAELEPWLDRLGEALVAIRRSCPVSCFAVVWRIAEKGYDTRNRDVNTGVSFYAGDIYL